MKFFCLLFFFSIVALEILGDVILDTLLLLIAIAPLRQLRCLQRCPTDFTISTRTCHFLGDSLSPRTRGTAADFVEFFHSFFIQSS